VARFPNTSGRSEILIFLFFLLRNPDFILKNLPDFKLHRQIYLPLRLVVCQSEQRIRHFSWQESRKLSMQKSGSGQLSKCHLTAVVQLGIGSSTYSLPPSAHLETQKIDSISTIF
jgi:hypothetical protein